MLAWLWTSAEQLFPWVSPAKAMPPGSHDMEWRQLLVSSNLHSIRFLFYKNKELMKPTVYQNSLVIPRSQIPSGDNKNWKLHFPCSYSLFIATSPSKLPSSYHVSCKHVRLRHWTQQWQTQSQVFCPKPNPQHSMILFLLAGDKQSTQPVCLSPAFPLLCLPRTRFLRADGGDSSGDWVRARRLLAESPLFKGGVEPGEA